MLDVKSDTNKQVKPQRQVRRAREGWHLNGFFMASGVDWHETGHLTWVSANRTGKWLISFHVCLRQFPGEPGRWNDIIKDNRSQ